MSDTYQDGFTDGVLLALQVLNAGGDCGNADYEELVNCAGMDRLWRRAQHQKMQELSGLKEYRRTTRINERLTRFDNYRDYVRPRNRA